MAQHSAKHPTLRERGNGNDSCALKLHTHTHTHLYQSLLEQYLCDLFEDREQSRVMDANTSLEERKEVLHLRNLLVLFGETVHGICKYFFN